MPRDDFADGQRPRANYVHTFDESALCCAYASAHRRSERDAACLVAAGVYVHGAAACGRNGDGVQCLGIEVCRRASIAALHIDRSRRESDRRATTARHGQRLQ